VSAIILRKDSTPEQRMSLVERFIAALPTDKAWKVEVSRYRKARSDQQNNALWGVAYKAIRDETGNDFHALHDYFCGEFFGWVDAEVMGMTKRRPLRTTTRDSERKRSVLSTVEFMDFYAFVQRRAAEVAGVYVPDPNEVME
jgi:hypothetical protein